MRAMQEIGLKALAHLDFSYVLVFFKTFCGVLSNYTILKTLQNCLEVLWPTETCTSATLSCLLSPRVACFFMLML